MSVSKSARRIWGANPPQRESFTLTYDRTGLKRLVGRMGKLKTKLAVVGATGELQRQVAAALWTGGIAVAAINPRWVRGYARGSGLLAKTDRIDAKLLVLFAQREQPVPRPRLDAETQALQELATRRDQLIEMDGAEQQRLQRTTLLRKEWRHHIAYLVGRITEIDADIDKTVRRSQAWRRKSEVLRSFPGVGKCSAPRCWPNCRNWARSAAKPLRHCSASRRSPMIAAASVGAESSWADAIRFAASFTCAR
jgi:transposase